MRVGGQDWGHRVNSFSVVIETENLAIAGVESLDRCLGSLEQQTFDIRKANEVWLMVGTHLDPKDAEQVVARYPWVRPHVANAELSYFSSKRLGAQLSTGDVIVFADSDVAYEPEWLATLFRVRDHVGPGHVVASGTRLLIRNPYDFAVQTTWMMPILGRNDTIRAVKSFHLNNFSIDRQAMVDTPFDDDLPLYRGALGFWKRRLRNNGISFIMVPGVIARHLAPPAGWEWFLRMLVFGSDYVAKSEYLQRPDGALVARHGLAYRLIAAPRWMLLRLWSTFAQTIDLLRYERGSWRYVLLGLPIALASLFVVWVGAIIAIVKPRYAYDRLAALEDEG